MNSLVTDNQVDRALEALPTSAPSDNNPEAPQTPFPTSLILNRTQEDALVDHVMNREMTLVAEMGRVVQPQGSMPVPDPNTWMGRREMWTLRYYNHVADRARKGTIFEQSNITAAISQRIAKQMIARANNFFFSTDPWFNATPTNLGGEPEAQQELEDRIDRHAHWKADQRRLVRMMESSTEFAFVRGETVTKTTYEVRQQRYKKKGNALVDAQGQLIPDAEGNPIFDDAQWVDEMMPAAMPAAAPPDIAMAGQPVITPMQSTGRIVLKSDGVTPQPPQLTYQAGVWPCHVITDEGARTDIVYFKDFLCPLDAPSVHEADICIHLYSLPVMRLVEMFKRDDLAAAGVRDLETLQRAVDMLRNMSGAGVTPQDASSQPRGDHGEKGNTAPTNSPDTNIIEAWVTFDVDGDGIQEEVMVVIDKNTRFPIYYDYTANVTVKGRRPFEVTRPCAVDGRWYGIGAMEYFEPEQEFIDLLLNRKNFRMSQAGRITWWNPHVTVEGRAQPRLPMNFGKTYTLLEGYKGEDLAGFIEIPDDSENLMDLINFMMQLMQLKSGVINAGDQEASGLPTSNTATGINDVAKSGQEMFEQYLASLKIGHTDTLTAFILTTYRNMNRAEIFRFFRGDTAGLDSIEPDEVRHLDFIITILLTRQSTEKVLQTSAQASSLIKDYYLQPPLIQQKVTPFYRKSVGALGYNDARDVIGAVPIQSGAPGDPNAQGAIGGGQANANAGPPAAPDAAPPAPPQPAI